MNKTSTEKITLTLFQMNDFACTVCERINDWVGWISVGGLRDVGCTNQDE